MGMWAVIFALTFVGAAAAFLYLVHCTARLGFVKKLAHGKRKAELGIGAGIIVALTAVLWLAWGSVNAIVCLIHLVAFRLIAGGVCLIIKKARKKPLKRNWAQIAALPITAVYLGAGWVLAHHVWRTDYAIKTEKQVGDIRVVQISDSHVGATFDGEGFAKHMENIAALSPDVVLVTGDFVDDDTSLEDMQTSCKALGELKKSTKYGVYFAYGNHDKGYYASQRGYTGEDLARELEANGVKVLEDESVLIDDRFYIIGRQDRSVENEQGGSRADMAALMSGLDADKFSIVMDHQPCDYEAQQQAGADLVLSGHTHGGQLIPINWINKPVSENERVYGSEKRGDTEFIVSSGISDWAMKFKTGCHSEYVVIDISGK